MSEVAIQRTRLVVFYLTEDIHNEKQRNELEFLSSFARVVLVGPRGGPTNSFGLRHVALRPTGVLAARAMVAWSRFVLLFSRLANSRMDQFFPVRNVYLGSGAATALVNVLWRLKRVGWINRLLPSYDALFFAPFLISRSRKRHGGRFRRIFMHDALLVQLRPFARLVTQVRAGGECTIGIVKSWDNPFYTQLGTRVSGYLVWSDAMLDDIRRAHRLPRLDFAHSWGARSFLAFRESLLARPAEALQETHGELVLGYAAAFCDPLMVEHETSVLCELAATLRESLPGSRVLFRPYPTIDQAQYAALGALSNVTFVDIEGEVVDRFGDGRERIRFGSNAERIDYLAACHVFLSLGTSFTIEAAMTGLPIIHLYLPPAARTSPAQRELFKRIGITDHLERYFEGELACAHSFEALVQWLQHGDRDDARRRASHLLRLLGVPGRDDHFHLPTPALSRALEDLAAAQLT